MAIWDLYNQSYFCPETACPLAAEANYCCNSGDLAVAVNGLNVSCSTASTGAPYSCQMGGKTTSSVSSVVSTSVSTSVDTIVQITETAPPTQASLVKAAGDVNLTAANHEANAGVLFCAEGANNELESAGSGAGAVSDCQKKFAAADQLAQMSQKLGKDSTLARDEGMLNSEAALAQLEKFEKNFGISKEDYVSRMLVSHGKSSEFADMLSSKFSDEKLDKLFADAAGAQPAQGTEVAAAQSGIGGGKAVKKDTSLRDSLRAKLDAADANRKLASATSAAKSVPVSKAAGEKLQPAGLDHWIHGSEEEKEAYISLFDIMHSKLEELRRREKI